ncbi:hypothetical protein, partial [Streptomyces sp. NPDC047966]|uniref:hypothetical protein n=1 Tax=Streptomyces sp. NPDC047966 TaxID=3155745 RepID=UPI0034439174
MLVFERQGPLPTLGRSGHRRVRTTPAAGGCADVRSGLSAGATRMFVHGVFDAPVTEAEADGV